MTDAMYVHDVIKDEQMSHEDAREYVESVAIIKDIRDNGVYYTLKDDSVFYMNKSSFGTITEEDYNLSNNINLLLCVN